MSRRPLTKGKCKYCGKEYTRTYMIKHLKTCEARKNKLEDEMNESGSRTGYFTITISSLDKVYWLIIEMDETATLKDLDEFIRDIWVECCGHLSNFLIDDVEYECDRIKDHWGWRRHCRDMNIKLSDVLRVGMEFSYEYDYGSSTDLVLNVVDRREGAVREGTETILSRNEPVEIICQECGERPARYIDVEALDEGESGFLCEECAKELNTDEDGELDEYWEDDYLPVCNSPRMGVCAYCGSVWYPDEFEPDV